MITTLCLNPSFDRTVQVDSMTVGGTNRVRAARTDAGGKGINVLRVCAALGAEARCVVLAGEDNLPRLKALMAREGLAERLDIRGVAGEIRTNTKIRSLDGQPLTELNEAGAAADAEAMRDIGGMLARADAPESWLVFTGSLPPGCEKGTYARMMAGKSGKCILDVGGMELMLGLQARPYLIKPNLDELRLAVGRPLDGMADIVAAARHLMTLGAQNVVVSMGGDGALLVTPEGQWLAPSIPVEVSSTVGAGDAMVAGLLTALSKGGSLTEAFRYAVACGTASVMTEGTQPPAPEAVAALLPRVTMGAC